MIMLDNALRPLKAARLQVDADKKIELRVKQTTTCARAWQIVDKDGNHCKNVCLFPTQIVDKDGNHCKNVCLFPTRQREGHPGDCLHIESDLAAWLRRSGGRNVTLLLSFIVLTETKLCTWPYTCLGSVFATTDKS